jgi:1-acyl-sn-glycerol-3-phosphate acyltransferase
MVAASAVALNTVIMATLIYVFALFKFLAPSEPSRDRVRHGLARLAVLWVSVNNLIIGSHRHLKIDLQVPEDLDANGCYIVNCNHQSWVDIPLLQRALNRRAPFMRFFLKKELIWVPFLGVAWWALDFPFMARVDRKKLARNPGLKGKDLQTAREACEKFRRIPVSMMNFLEGTRFTPQKHDAQKSPYRHLLKPRIGGLGQVLYSLGDQLDSLIDVTIVYPDGRPSFWDLLSGRLEHVIIVARKVPIPDHLRGRNFRSDRGFRSDLDAWTQALWVEKDQQIDDLLSRNSSS